MLEKNKTLSLQDIAKSLNLSTNTVDSILCRADFNKLRCSSQNEHGFRFIINDDFKNLFIEVLKIRCSSGRCLVPTRIKYSEMIENNLKALDF